MKRLLLSATILGLASTAAFADGLTSLGLDDPEVMAPPSVSGDWSGPYVGLSYGRTKASSSVTEYSEQCFKKFNDSLGKWLSDDPVDCATYAPPEGDTVTTNSTSDAVGGFLGYRHDFGRIVGGAEIGVNGDLKTLEAQVGLDLGKVLPYAFAGVGDLDGESGNTYGVGADMALGKNLMVGVKTTRGEFGNTELNSTLLRVAIQF